MANHITIEIKLKGDLISGISESLNIAKALKSHVFLTLWEGKTIRIGHESDVQDLITIAMLEKELNSKNKEG